MPARDGSGPLGRGSRTGRGLGNCVSGKTDAPLTMSPATTRPLGWGRRLWNTAFGRLFRRGRANHGYRN